METRDTAETVLPEVTAYYAADDDGTWPAPDSHESFEAEPSAYAFAATLVA